MLIRYLTQAPRLIRAIGRRIGMRGTTAAYRVALGGIGKGTRIQAGARLAPAHQVFVGQDCFLWAGVDAGTESATGRLRLGNRVQINRNVHLDFTGGLDLADDVLISEEAVIYTHDHGLDPRSAPALAPKTVGAGVWIGMRAVILPQCRHIGAGAVIGAGAIVTRDVPPGAIVAGNPAVIIGYRAALEVAA